MLSVAVRNHLLMVTTWIEPTEELVLERQTLTSRNGYDMHAASSYCYRLFHPELDVSFSSVINAMHLLVIQEQARRTH